MGDVGHQTQAVSELARQIADQTKDSWGWLEGIPNSWTTYTNGEKAQLIQCALDAVPEGGMIVEIGCFGGRSLTALCEVARIRHAQVIGVDPLVYYADLARPHLDAVLDQYKDVVTFYEMQSAKAAIWMEQVPVIDFLHIDGDHEDCATDCNVWLPHLRPGGLVAIHDACDDPHQTDGGYVFKCGMEGTPGYSTYVYNKTDNFLLVRRKPE